MATAYGAFTSLMHLIADLRKHPRPPIKLDEQYVVALNSKISFFQRFLEDHHSTVDRRLETLMTDAAHTAEGIIETQIANRVLDQKHFYGSFQRIIEGLNLLEKEVTEMKKQSEQQGNNQPRPPLPSESSSATSGENVAVGIDDITIEIIDKLTSQHKSSRQIISISGMGGIGKTTLANKVYNHPYIKNYFDICAWATISKDYNICESLVEILHCLDKNTNKECLNEKNEHELGEKVHKFLSGRRYLVILDNVWDVEPWDRLRSFFPATCGSGIVITSREPMVASISSHHIVMDFLDESKSWDLLCKNIFGNDSCPRQLEDVGKTIAKKCRGLPLSIVVIGRHLEKSPRTQEYWRYIARNLSSIVNSEDNDHCLKVLSLSYIHLPVHLKPCFLYMAIFPEGKEIRVSQLKRLWVAEGFLKPINGKSLEEAAEDYLNDLVRRNLILPSMSSLRGKLKRFTIHDLLRDLCVKEALKNNFLRIVGKKWLDIQKVSNYERRVVIYPSASNGNDHLCGDGVFQSPALLRTLLFDGILPSVDYKLLRVLSPVSGFLHVKQKTWVKDVMHNLVNLRCLDFDIIDSGKRLKTPPSLAHFWNLQSLAIPEVSTVIAPLEIWKMPQLRHINAKFFSLPDPPSESSYILKNLQTAKTIWNPSFSEDLVERIPNIKRLRVLYHGLIHISAYFLDISRLEKLASFDCIFYSKGMLSEPTFPHSLKKLSFNSLHWDVVTAKIGSLPLLEVLILYDCWGLEWKLVDGQFVRLKFLKICECYDLRCFTANNQHLPCLQELSLYLMPSLEEISSDIGDIPTLTSIKLLLCPDSAVVCAKEIAEVNHEMGSEELEIEVALCHGSSLSSESLSARNFRVRN